MDPVCIPMTGERKREGEEEASLTPSEIIFNPMRYWFTRGPFTKLFRQFLVSPMPTHTKWGVLAYMSSYYAFALAWSGTLLNFVLIGVFAWNDQFCECLWLAGICSLFLVHHFVLLTHLSPPLDPPDTSTINKSHYSPCLPPKYTCESKSPVALRLNYPRWLADQQT